MNVTRLTSNSSPIIKIILSSLILGIAGKSVLDLFKGKEIFRTKKKTAEATSSKTVRLTFLDGSIHLSTIKARLDSKGFFLPNRISRKHPYSGTTVVLKLNPAQAKYGKCPIYKEVV